jgi:hypothetical protein
MSIWLARLGLLLLAGAVALSGALILVSFGDPAWIATGGMGVLSQWSSLLYGSLVVGMVLNFPLTLVLWRLRRLSPEGRTLPMFAPLWPAGVVVLLGFAFLLGALYLSYSWVSPPQDGTLDALVRLTQAGAVRNLRSMSLNTMGLALVYGGLMLSWHDQYARLRRDRAIPS